MQSEIMKKLDKMSAAVSASWLQEFKICALAAIVATLFSCSKEGPSESLYGTTNRPVGIAISPNPSGSSPISGVVDIEKDDRTWDQVLCQSGRRFINLEETTDFSEEFAMICDKDNNLTPDFVDTIAKAYEGNGAPIFKFNQRVFEDSFVAELTYSYAIKLKTGDPTKIMGAKPHDALISGVRANNSEVLTTVLDREYFPKRRKSVEKIILRYEMPKVQGAGIYDVQLTEANTYLLTDTRKDVAMQTEYLIDLENQEYYHDVRHIVVIFTPDNVNTYMFRQAHYFVKNRVDPDRLGAATKDINNVSIGMLHSYLAAKLEAAAP